MRRGKSTRLQVRGEIGYRALDLPWSDHRAEPADLSGGCGFGLGLSAEPGLQTLVRQGPAEEVTLADLAAHLLQQIERQLALRPLSSVGRASPW